MNKIIKIVAAFIAGFIAVSLASTAYADINTNAVVKDYYNGKTITSKKPVKTCNEVDIPIYQQQQGQGSLGDFLAGAIIGGAIGNNVSNDKGAGAVGAIIGGAIANENAKKKNTTANIVGYKRETVCETTMVEERQQLTEYSYSIITFEYEGDIYRVKFIKR